VNVAGDDGVNMLSVGNGFDDVLIEFANQLNESVTGQFQTQFK